MSDRIVGLPENFALNVQADDVVELGDYLDETAPIVTVKEPSTGVTSAQENQASQNNPALVSNTDSTGVTRKPKRKRRQINMSPATEQKFNKILEHVRDYGPQDDTAASELIDAIIAIHHDALAHLKLGSVKPRGRWGTPTATAFKDSLSRAFEVALLDFHKFGQNKNI